MPVLPDYETLCLFWGLILGMLFFRQTGYGSGGMITPGIIAMRLNQPLDLVVALLCGIVIWLLLRLLIRYFEIYGRQRLAVAMLMALVLRGLAGMFWPMESLWLGWVVPGLMGADMEKFGFAPTLAGALAISLASAFAAEISLWALA